MNRRGILSRATHRAAVVGVLLAVLITAACVPSIPGIGSLGQGSVTQSPGTAPVPQTGGSGTASSTSVTPSVTVNDQTYDGTSVVVADVVSKGSGWIAIHNQVNGAVGPVIGMTPVQDGDNKNVTVKVDPNQTTPTMYAMLHTDQGKLGVYEFPGPDIPVSINGQMITPAFKATKQTAGSSVTPVVTVSNQVVSNGQITIAEVDSPGPGWIAIHVMMPDGTPGNDIGFSAVKPGKNTNVVVTVDQTKVTQTMFAMLHTDDGEVGMYEFPTHDAPVVANGKMIAAPFATDGKTPAANANTVMHDMGQASAAGSTATEPPNEVYPTGSPTAGTESPNEVYPTTSPTAAMSAMANPTATQSMAMQTPAPDVTPMVKVSDQPLNNGMVKVDDVVSGAPGWVVIYTTNASGQPDQPIGHAAVQKGDNKNVMVQVDPAKAKGKLYAQLHVDAGQVGTFEFPGPDMPLMIGVQMISGLFNVTAPVAAAPTATQMAAMPMPTSAPNNNPPASGSGTQPFIKTADQPIINGTVVIPEVYSAGDAWLVIHRQNGDGTEGAVVGYVRVKDGDNTNVAVRVDTSLTSTTMFAMLHEDKGKIGRLEFPGPDVPVMVNGVMVNIPFTITGNKAADVVINVSTDQNTTKHLVDGYSMSLYLSLQDRPGQSNCNADCLHIWKPLLANGRVVAGSGVASNKLGVIILPDGTRQVTYNGAPLYTYTDDSKPGDINGQGLDGNWFLVTP